MQLAASQAEPDRGPGRDREAGGAGGREHDKGWEWVGAMGASGEGQWLGTAMEQRCVGEGEGEGEERNRDRDRDRDRERERERARGRCKPLLFRGAYGLPKRSLSKPTKSLL